MLSCRDMAPLLSTHSPTTKGGERWCRKAPKGENAFPTPAGRLYGFIQTGAFYNLKAPTSPAGTVSQPIGKPFNGQAKGLLWLTWRSYAGPPQYYITPEGESPQPACKAKPITGRTLAAQGQRPGGWLNPHARKGVSTFGNTGKRRPADWYLPTFESLAIFTEILRSAQDDSGRRGSPIPVPIPTAPTGRAPINFLKVNIFRHL